MKELEVEINGKKRKVIVEQPSKEAIAGQDAIENKVFQQAIKDGCMSNYRMQQWLKEEGIWTEKDEDELMDFQLKIAEGEEQLKRGGITADGKKFTKADARELAINMRKWRFQSLILITRKNAHMDKTVDGKAKQARFDYLVSQCCKFKSNKKPVFEDYEDYIAKKEEQYAIELTNEFAEIYYELPDERDKAENKFLLEHKFVSDDENLRLVNEEGKPIDLDGNVVEESEEDVKEVQFVPFED